MCLNLFEWTMRCCWVFVIVFDFCYYFCTSLPFISRGICCAMPRRDVTCVFFSLLIYNGCRRTIPFELNTEKHNKKTMAMLRAWFLTPPQRKWNERAKSVRDARKPLFRMNLTDWLGQKRNKYTKLHMEHFHHFSFMWSALCVFLYQQQITI